MQTERANEQEPAAPAKKAPKRRYGRALLWSTVFLSIGFISGTLLSALVVPPPIPEIDGKESEILLSGLRKDLGGFEFVKELRERREEWVEFEAYSSQSSDSRSSSMTAGILQGYGGLGLQRVFWNQKEKRLISVVFLGGALSGWPGVVHGGLIATILQENLERVANGYEIGSGGSPTASWVLGQLDITYRKPTQAQQMFVVKAELEDTTEESAFENKGLKVKATMENAITGQLCAQATGYCSPRRGL